MVDLEKFCIAFGWNFGTALERKAMRREPDDGHTPESLWESQKEEDREFFRGVVRKTLTDMGIEYK